MKSLRLLTHTARLQFGLSEKVCHYHAGITFSNPLAWPVAWVIESIGFVEDLWNEGLLSGLQGVGRSRHFLYERVRLKINEHIVITRKEAE